MNGFADHGLDESAFAEKQGLGDSLRTFDAFPKTKATYVRRSSTGGYTTILLIVISTLLSFTEFRRWYRGNETQHFSIEKGVSHTMQINLDAVVLMKCSDLHVNVQDASGDRILAGEMLNLESTSWHQWVDSKGLHRLGSDDRGRREELEEEDTHVGHVLGEVRRGKRKFKKTPRIRGAANACRVFGSIEGNKVMGDFHITARGHGYSEFGQHLDHDAFNFSHLISELSFGPLYPSLLNPLDQTLATTGNHFQKFQYYLSIVPTIYTLATNPSKIHTSRNTIVTNQYAVTSQSQEVSERSVPGIFWKFDIEPILLTISEERGGFLTLCVRIVNVVSGILVGGGWCYQLVGWAREILGREGRRRGKSGGEGMLHGRKDEDNEDD
ncbi:hypothetical protein MMC20_007523 [Loxospora ochrophaea]|nr:hypothetical protein [Loxospora ochrophaea]